MPCYSIDGVIPVVSPEAFVHPTAVLIGDVIIEAGVYVGPLLHCVPILDVFILSKMPIYKIAAPYMVFRKA